MLKFLRTRGIRHSSFGCAYGQSGRQHWLANLQHSMGTENQWPEPKRACLWATGPARTQPLPAAGGRTLPHGGRFQRNAAHRAERSKKGSRVSLQGPLEEVPLCRDASKRKNSPYGPYFFVSLRNGEFTRSEVTNSAVRSFHVVVLQEAETQFMRSQKVAAQHFHIHRALISSSCSTKIRSGLVV